MLNVTYTVTGTREGLDRALNALDMVLAAVRNVMVCTSGYEIESRYPNEMTVTLSGPNAAAINALVEAMI